MYLATKDLSERKNDHFTADIKDQIETDPERLCKDTQMKGSKQTMRFQDDNMIFTGTQLEGETSACLVVMKRTHCTAYQLQLHVPKHGTLRDRGVIASDRRSWSCGSQLKIICMEPLRSWCLQYNGLMTSTTGSEHHVRFTAL